MPVLTASTPRAPAAPEQEQRRAATLAQVRTALALIGSDPAARQLVTDSAVAHAAGGLTDWLYVHWWCGSQGPEVGGPTDPGEPARGAARLEAARRTVAARSGGWLVLAAVADQLVAARLAPPERDGPPPLAERRVRTTAAAVVTSSRPGMPARPGDLVTLRHGESGLDPTGSWWWAHTGRPDELTSQPLDRWYVHARSLPAAVALVPLLLATVSEVGGDVSLKCPPARGGYGRSDALVVYLPRDRSPAAEAALRRRADAVADLVEPDQPPLTRPLLPGVAQAEDPGRENGPVSYGQLRCRQVAALAVRVLGGTAPSSDLDDAALVGALADLGIDVDAPHRVRP